MQRFIFNKEVSKLSAKIVLVFLFISPRFLINTEQEKKYTVWLV